MALFGLGQQGLNLLFGGLDSMQGTEPEDLDARHAT